ncbi:MAG: hypothetical protein EOO78_27085, partial [Oxalobacteraceae bacterium]
MQRSQEASDGLLLKVLQHSWALPHTLVHHRFAPPRRRQASFAAGEDLVRLLAEAGLVDRPLHLFVGDSSFAECLSPYTRDLREQLLAWQATASSEPVDAEPSEDTLYELAASFVRSDPRLPAEKQVAERSVGIVRHHLDAGCELTVVDSVRLDWRCCDARLQGVSLRSAPPVLVGLQGLDAAYLAPLLLHLLEVLGERLAGMLFVSHGAAQGARWAEIYLGTRLEQLRGGGSICLPSTALRAEDLRDLIDKPRSDATFYSGPSLAFGSHLRRTLGAANATGDCLTYAAAEAALALQDVQRCGNIPPCLQLGWACINAHGAGLQAAVRR